jgi:hypothetical protein
MAIHTRPFARMRRSLFALVLCAALLSGCNPGASRADRYFVANLAEKYARRGDELAADNRPAEALLAYRQAALADPGYAPGLQRLAGAYAAQGQRRLAAALYERILANMARQEGAADRGMERLARRELSVLYTQLGQTELAADQLRRLAQAGDPEAQRALDDLGAKPQPKPLWSLRWQKHLELAQELLPGENVPSGLVAANGMLFVTAQEGMLYALDAVTGAERWRYDTGSTGSKRRVTSAPVVASGLVLFGADDNIVRALSAPDGALLWRYETGGQVFGAPFVDGDTVYVASADGVLYALSLADGKLRWQHELGEAFHTSPFVRDGVVYVGAQDMQLHAIAAADGKELWTFLTAGKVESPAIVSGPMVYVGSGDSRLYALDRLTGSLAWYYSTGDAVYAPPVVSNGFVYVASMGQIMAALAADTGQVAWEYYADTPLRFAPVPLGGRLYLSPAADPVLYALDAVTGQVVAQQDTGEWPACQPILAEGVLYVAQRDSTVLAYQVGSE